MKTLLGARHRRRQRAVAAAPASAEDIKEFRIGILGGENEADRLRNYQCLPTTWRPLLGVEKV